MAEADRWALAVFCSALPELRVKASDGFWEDTLDMHVAEVAGGGSALAACRELSLDLNRPSPHRGDGAGIDGAATDWIPAPVVLGGYVCPLRRCVRRGERDEQGRPPRCAVAGEQMTFRRA